MAATISLARRSAALGFADRSPPAADRRLPAPGTVLTRNYKGALLHVRVLPGGFEYQGLAYKSLSAVAKAITGAHCNGFLFFQDALSNPGGPR